MVKNEKWLAVAKKNGIKNKIYSNRISRGWSPERASTQPPVKKVREDRIWWEIAKQNGIKYETFINRVERLGWSPDKAATTLGRTKVNRPDSKWVKVAEQNGIDRTTYCSRVDKFGWEPEDAATTPPNKRDDQEWIKLAKANGVSRSSYCYRVDELFWSPEGAATTPPLTQEEIIKGLVEVKKEYYEIKIDRINKDPNNLFKFTPQHLESAKQNGICEGTFADRIYNQGMTVQEAIATPLKNKLPTEYYHYREVAKLNGITAESFRYRVNKGWTYEEASSIPMRDNKKRRRPDGDWVDKAVANGIKESVYIKRIKLGWTPEEAATTPKLKPGEFLNDTQKTRHEAGFRKFRGLGTKR